ncbi:MAG: hypothetical protein AABZ47_11275 [Planctomycetota bacterium]
MRRFLVLASLSLFFVGSAFGQQGQPAKPAEKPKAQESEKTTITQRESKIAKAGYDVLTELWSFEDATPVSTGQVDLRLTLRWFPEPAVDDDDDSIVQPSIVWGVAENWELSAAVPAWLCDNGNRGPYEDGNYDTFLGALWRFAEQEGYWPAMALGAKVRIPTGEGSDGIDGVLRLNLTNEYDSGIRSHVNGLLKTVNTNNDNNLTDDDDFNWWTYGSGGARDFQWGVVLGLDGPLSDDARWVVDVIHRSSETNGQHNITQADAGLEYQLADNQRLGWAFNASLDHANNDAPYYGVSLTYAYSLAR